MKTGRLVTRPIILIIWTMLLSAQLIWGAENIVIGGLDGLDPYQQDDEYHIGLALSGGGTRGFTVIGMLRAFEEKGIRTIGVAGTSMGGIVGGLYASGYDPDRLAAIIRKIDFNRLFSNAPARKTMFLTQRQDRDRHLISIRFDGFRPVIPHALTAGQKLNNILTNLTTRPNYHSAGNFDRLPIPFRTVCTDIVTGDEVVLGEGSLTDAMRATMAFPLAFTGVDKGPQLLMDGGMVVPVPVDLVREICPPGTFVVAVNTTSPLQTRSELLTPVDIANQVTTIMASEKLQRQLDRANFVVTPSLAGIRSNDFKYRDSLIELGYAMGLRTADSVIEMIKANSEESRFHISEVVIGPGLSSCCEPITSVYPDLKVDSTSLVRLLKQYTIEMNLFQLEARLDFAVNTENSAELTNGGARLVKLSLDGFPTMLQTDLTIIFTGNTIFDDLTLAKHLVITDSMLTPEEFRRGLDRILNLYYVNNYNLANIHRTEIDPETKMVRIDIDEARISEIRIDGNLRSREWFVKSYFPLKEGDPYSTRRAARGIANIYGTDLFDRVTVDLAPTDSGAIVTIGVVEKKYSQLRLGWHWDDHYTAEEFAEYLDDNLFGAGLEVLAHARFGPERKDYHFLFKTNRIGATYLAAQAKIYHNRLSRQSYNEDSSPGSIRREHKTGFDIRLGQQIARFGTVTAVVNLEEVTYRNLQNETTSNFGLRIFKLESLVETFDRIPYPESGKKHLFQLQFVGKFLGGDVEFTRFYSTIEAYFPISRRLNFHPKMAVGISRSGLPPSEKFFIGGLESFAGYHTDELFGDKMFLFNNELRFKVPYRFYLTARYDLGDVYEHTDDIKLRNLRHGFGLSLSYDSPVGPFVLGYGVNDADIDRVYFSAGLSF